MTSTRKRSRAKLIVAGSALAPPFSPAPRLRMSLNDVLILLARERRRSQEQAKLLSDVRRALARGDSVAETIEALVASMHARRAASASSTARAAKTQRIVVELARLLAEGKPQRSVAGIAAKKLKVSDARARQVRRKRKAEIDELASALRTAQKGKSRP